MTIMDTASRRTAGNSGCRCAPPPPDGIVCFAGVDWWYHNRGHSECQVMSRLARRLPVLWINSLGMRAPSPGKTELVLHRYVRKLKSTFKGLQRDESGMWVYSPLFVPRYSPRMVELNGRLVGAQVSMLMRRLKVRSAALWTTIPTAAPMIERGHWTTTVFNRSDDFAKFPEADGAFIRPLELRLLRGSETVVYVNRALFERERSSVSHAEFIGHGVDFDHFASARPGTSAPTSNVPPEVANLPRPIVGFYGALDDYTIDLDLMIKTARKVAPGTLLVIGPKAMDISRLLAEPNVVYLGPVPYARLPAYAAQFDAAIMPWLQNDWIAGCNPIKLKEYLALGFPIVTMRFPELGRYEELVYSANSHDAFLSGITAALGERDPRAVERRREAVHADSWDALADRVGALMGVQGEHPCAA